MNHRYKRLFKIEHKKLETEYFNNKMLAKKRRNELINEGYDVVVKRGPDHNRGET